jgi:hypothetical protein
MDKLPPMPIPKWNSELQKVVDGELLSLRFLDPRAWEQIGDYMAEVKRRINLFVKAKDVKDPSMTPLCVSLMELENEYQERFSQPHKIERDGDIVEPRVIRLLAVSRARIGKRIHEGTVDLGTIKSISKIWPKTKEQKEEEEKKLGSDKALISKWAKEGFEID